MSEIADRIINSVLNQDTQINECDCGNNCTCNDDRDDEDDEYADEDEDEDDDWDDEDDDQAFNAGYEDFLKKVTRACDCGECVYCEGYIQASEEDEFPLRKFPSTIRDCYEPVEPVIRHFQD